MDYGERPIVIHSLVDNLNETLSSVIGCHERPIVAHNLVATQVKVVILINACRGRCGRFSE